MNNKIVIISFVLLAALFIYANQNTKRIQEVPTPSENARVDAPGTLSFEGAITAYDTGCFADATCSVTVDGKTVILVTGGRAMGEQAVGQLMGVESIGDLEQKIGSQAQVYAKQLSENEYTLYGDTAYYVKVL